MSNETLRIWAWRLALATAIIVGILSWLTKVSFLWVMLRMIFTFLLMYGLSYASLYGFEKAASPSEDDLEKDSFEGEVNEGRGAFLDVAVGQEDMDTPLAGQVDADLSEGLPNAEKQADMVRRMGWGE